MLTTHRAVVEAGNVHDMDCIPVYEKSSPVPLAP